MITDKRKDELFDLWSGEIIQEDWLENLTDDEAKIINQWSAEAVGKFQELDQKMKPLFEAEV